MQRYITQISFTILTALLIGGVMFVAVARAQDESADSSDEQNKRLIERRPFDRIQLDERNMNKVYEIVPLAGRPPDPLIFAEVANPGLKMKVAMSHVVKYETFADLLLAEARRLSDANDFDQAYEYFDFLNQNYPDTPGLKADLRKHLFSDANRLYEVAETLKQSGKTADAIKKYQEALSVIKELYARPDFVKSATLSGVLASCLDRLIDDYFEHNRYAAARDMLGRIEREFGEEQQPLVERWVNGLRELAGESMKDAQRHMEGGRGRAAHEAVRAMLNIWPTIEGGVELSAEVIRRFPMVVVGVSQPATFSDPRSLDNWGALRTGRLTHRMLLEYMNRGPEGGTYICPLGSFGLNEDGTQLRFDLTPVDSRRNVPALNAYDISERLLDMADPRHASYVPGWSQLMTRIEVPDVNTIVIDLRFPHVLPEAFLQMLLEPPREGEPADQADGPYVVSQRSDTEITFVENPRYKVEGAGKRPEIIERYFSDSQKGVEALQRGELDMIDRVFPADVPRLRADPSIAVGSYELPTIHVLIPNLDNALLRNPMFRRAIDFGINRHMILGGVLLGNHMLPGCRVISGPFPAGVSDNDSMAYAYNERIRARLYEPYMAATLVSMAKAQLLAPEVRNLKALEGLFQDAQELYQPSDPEFIEAQRNFAEGTKKLDEFKRQLDEDAKITLAHPAGEVAKVACQSISEQLQAIGLECQLLEMPVGVTQIPQEQYDLRYSEVTMWEPIVDARRLLGLGGVAGTAGTYELLALHRLDSARSWSHTRRYLYELHEHVHNGMSVIPLWQILDHYARRKSLVGVGDRPLTLYQNVNQWQNLQGPLKE